VESKKRAEGDIVKKDSIHPGLQTCREENSRARENPWNFHILGKDISS
jgi:hypothetical protein